MRLFRPEILMIALLGAGCIKVEQDLALKPDGSATLVINYTVPDETSQRIKAMMRLADELTQASPDALRRPSDQDLTQLVFDPTEKALRTKIESYKALGITLRDLAVRTRSAQREVRIELFIRDVSRLPEADFFENYGFSLRQSAAGRYVFFNRPVTREPIDRTWNANDPEIQKLLTPLLGGFSFSLNVSTPGRILKSNAERRTAYTGGWSFNYDTDPYAVAKLQRAEMKLVFDSSGLNLPEVIQPRSEPVSEATEAVAPVEPEAVTE